MRSICTYVAIAVLGLSSLATATDISLKNWTAPKTWTPSTAQAIGGRSALAAATYPPLPFIPVVPCRIVDTRGNGQTGAFGTPQLSANTSRTIPVPTHPTCTGIPATAGAYSLNITVTNTGSGAFGYLQAWPTGQTQPTSSTLNYPGAGATLANAAVVPAGTAGSIDVFSGNASADVIIDINGYYGPTPADPTQYFTLNTNSSLFTMRLDNASTTCTGVCGLFQTVAGGTAIRGQTSSTDPTEAGVYGYANAGFGVQGQTHSKLAEAAGILGRDGIGAGNPTGYSSAGVRGEGAYGVVGVSNTVSSYAIVGNAISPAFDGVVGTANDFFGAGVVGQAVAPATVGVFAYGQLGATGAKPFFEPHPSDASKEIRYVALEGPEAGTYFRGTATTVGRQAVIQVPDTFRIVTAEEGLTVQVTPIGEFAQLVVMSRDLNQIVVQSSRDVTFDYLVHGVRRAFTDWQVVADGAHFRPTSPTQTMPSWVTEEAKKRLIANGTYNADGTVNMTTAERLGWAQAWREQAAAAAAKVVTHP